MRLSAFLFAVILLAVLAFAESLSSRQELTSPRNSAQTGQHPAELWKCQDGGRMLRRAWIRVVPLDRMNANRTELESLRQRVNRAELEAIEREPLESALQRRQVALMEELLRFAERQEFEPVENPVAQQVQQQLNEIEGHVMCEACHSGVVAQINVSQTSLE
jgi:hypothetical protein